MGKQVKKHGYSCKLVRVVDGDTCDAMIDLGFDVWVKTELDLWVLILGKVELVILKKRRKV